MGKLSQQFTQSVPKPVTTQQQRNVVMPTANVGGANIVNLPDSAALLRQQEQIKLEFAQKQKEMEAKLAAANKQLEDATKLQSESGAKNAVIAAEGLALGKELMKSLKTTKYPNLEVVKGKIPFIETNTESLVKGMTDILGRLRSGGAITNDEFETFSGLLPSTFKPKALMIADLNRFMRQVETLGKLQLGPERFKVLMNDYENKKFDTNDVKPIEVKKQTVIKLD